MKAETRHPMVNPELMLKAAQLACPSTVWSIVTLSQSVILEKGAAPEFARQFNPLKNGADCWWLERYLKLTYNFGARVEPVYEEAESGDGRWMRVQIDEDIIFYAHPKIAGEIIEDSSDGMLLLKCVSAMTGLGVEGEG